LPFKGADLLVVALMVVNMALAPRMAAFFHEGRLAKLKRMCTDDVSEFE